jgi:hypothetical protein
MYGAMNCIDLTAAACGEMVFDLIVALGVPVSVEMATHIYLAILTDTGGFHYSHISPRTFDICRQCVEAGLTATAVSRAIYDNNNLGRVRIWGAVLNEMQLSPDGRVATLSMDRRTGRPVRRHLRRHRRADQLPAHREGDQAVVVLQGERPRRLAHQHALEGRRERQRDRPRVRRRRPHQRVGAAVPPATWRSSFRSFQQKLVRPSIGLVPEPSSAFSALSALSAFERRSRRRQTPGITSHDVVAVARRALGERGIGHTGTLDPMATGVLPLAIGKATRLARFLTASDKDYDAVIRFGRATDTYDATGTTTSEEPDAADADRRRSSDCWR